MGGTYRLPSLATEHGYGSCLPFSPHPCTCAKREKRIPRPRFRRNPYFEFKFEFAISFVPPALKTCCCLFCVHWEWGLPTLNQKVRSPKRTRTPSFSSSPSRLFTHYLAWLRFPRDYWLRHLHPSCLPVRLANPRSRLSPFPRSRLGG